MKKYSGRKLDLIVGVMGPSVTFLRRHADAFAPGVPIVFCGADANDLKAAALPARMTGLVVRRVFGPTLELALRLQPDTRHVFVVGGTSSFDRSLQATARRDFEPFETRVSFSYLTDLSMDDSSRRCPSVPPQSVVLYVTCSGTRRARRLSRMTCCRGSPPSRQLRSTCFVDQYLGLGPVGGYLYSVELHGKAAGDLGLRVLRGESPAAIPVREVPDNQFMFDIRQLDRWKLDRRLLPAGSVLMFREASVWDRYRVYIIGAAVLLAVQTILITGLLVQRARRRRAEGSCARASSASARWAGDCSARRNRSEPGSRANCTMTSASSWSC